MRNIPDEIQLAFPDAFQHCCACDGPFTREKMRWHGASFEHSACVHTVHIWTPCMLTYVSPEALGRFAVERLGYVGFFSVFLADFTPLTVLRSHPGLAWCVNNCFYPSVFHRLAVVDGAARQEMVDDGAELTHKEFRAKLSCARFTAGRKLDLLPRHVKHLVVVIAGANGGNISKSHLELTKAVAPHFVKLYVASEDDSALPILWAKLSDKMSGFSDYRARFVEFVFFLGVCAPIRYEWLLVIGDNTQISPRMFVQVVEGRNANIPTYFGDFNCSRVLPTESLCGDGGIVLSAEIMAKVSEKIGRSSFMADGGKIFRSYFSQSCDHHVAVLAKFLKEQGGFDPDLSVSNRFRGTGRDAVTTHPRSPLEASLRDSSCT
eukprot:gnl/TRDRNA2_/TRDRNA2_137596_c2_seq2.p1 gnl/TRDRNA2_/TRDRNA2_137596_c2~~gnl/TRDRNA2_/TRDRNA2_137596_c2_seq2.p1  ORF type:complete len:377 (+),score=50.10 gnl/TRDRNA2_/TRDRNA2_137596_c2_seq2:1-1131(+)